MKPELSKTDSKPEAEAENAPDTTEKHGQHLFDANCKICTGIVVPGTDTTPTKSQVSKTIIEQIVILVGNKKLRGLCENE